MLPYGMFWEKTQPRKVMVFLNKRTFLPATALLAVMALSACGGSGTSNADSLTQTPMEVQATPTTTVVDHCATATAIVGKTATAQSTVTPTGTMSATATAAATSTAHARATETSVAGTQEATATHTAGTPTPTVNPSTATAIACATSVAQHSNATTSASTSSENAEVKTASVDVNGKSATVLTDARGMTLYYSKEDSAKKSSCNKSCTTTWHPLLAGNARTAHGASLPGNLTVVKTDHGNQLAYNGHLLYTYAKDTASGQAKGESVDSKWYVVTTNLAMQH